MTLKDLFDKAENGTLTYEQLVSLMESGGAKFVDLSEGNYVSKQKFENELAGRSKEIDTLNETLATRDTDLQELQKQLSEAGTDAEKLASLASEFDALKGKYDEEVKSYKTQLKQQQYEFAVKDFAGTKTFSSNAAKRDFIQSMIAKGLKMEDGHIIGAEDFASMYLKDNEDAFMTEADYGYPDNNDVDLPHFVESTPGAQETTVDPTGGFASAFHFTPIHQPVSE